MKLQLPLVKKDNASYSAEELLKILAGEPYGHYLLGSHGFWHGGVHFTDKVTPEFKNTPVKAIADGTIVAYRISEKYVSFVFENTPKKIYKNHLYATSFCLIRHEYESPVATQKMKAAQVAPTDKKGWEGRLVELKDGGRNARNPYATSENDKTTTCTFQVLLPQGTRLKIVANYATDDNFYTAKIASFASKKTSETFNNAKGGKHTLNVGDEVFFHGFDKSGSPVFKDASNTMQDWSETQALVAKSNHRGYTFLLPSLPEEYIHIPAGTALTPTHMTTTSTCHGKVYIQVTANTPLDIYTENTCTTQQHPAKISFYVAVTDEFGNILTTETTDAQGKKQQTPVVENDTRNKLTFYSLYMHLLPLSAYDKDPNEGKNFIITLEPLDERTSANNHNGIGGQPDNRIGTTPPPKGTIYELVSTTPTIADGFELNQGHQVNAEGTRLSQDAVWIKKANTSGTWKGANTHFIPSTAKQHPHHWKHDNTIQCKALADVAVYTVQQHNGKPTLVKQDDLETGGKCTYHYPNDSIIFTQLVVAGKEADTELIKITLTQGLGKNRQLGCNKQLYLLNDEATFKNMKETFTPKKLDEVVPCNIPVKAGEPLGYLGLYETPSDGADETKVNKDSNKNSKHQLHFEIFTSDKDRIDAFLDNKAKVTTGKKYLKIPKRSFIMIGIKAGQQTRPLPALPAGLLDQGSNLVRDWIIPLSKVTIEEEKQPSQTIEWYKIPHNKFPDKNFAYVRKGVNNEELCQYDLRKLGFKIIEEENENSNGDMFVDAHNIKGTEYKEFFRAILTKIDKLGNDDNKVTADEVQKAYKDEDISEGLQKIIGYHPTEWQKGKMDMVEISANRIKADINSKDEGEQSEEQKSRLAAAGNDNEAIVKEFAGEDTLNFLKREQERMEKLQFWDEVEELKSTPKVWHFHPVRFIKQLQVESVVTFHIYENGDIEKHIPSSISDEFKNKYKYVYHDKNGGVHDVCTVDWHMTKKKQNGTRETSKPTHSPIVYDQNVSEGQTSRRVKYENNDIAEYGQNQGRYFWRLYKALKENIELVRMLDQINYTKDDITIKYAFSNTHRRYTNPAVLAGFIGALADIGVPLRTTGICFREASCFPSAEHVNGESVDTGYLDNDNDRKYINAMEKYHFSKILVGNPNTTDSNYKFRVPHFTNLIKNTIAANGGELHNHHIHAGGFSYQIKEVKV